MQSLTQITLETIIPLLDNEALKHIFQKCEAEKLIVMKQIIDQILLETKRLAYIVTNYDAARLCMKPVIIKFIKRYRNVSFNDDDGADYTFELHRSDPILVILAALFGQELQWHWEEFYLSPEEYIEIEYLEYVGEITDIKKFDANEYPNYDYRTLFGPCRYAIPERPIHLFKDMTELSKQTGWEMNMESAKYLPITGAYRLLD